VSSEEMLESLVYQAHNRHMKELTARVLVGVAVDQRRGVIMPNSSKNRV